MAGKTCIICSKTFRPRTVTTLCCSKTCSRERKRLLDQAYGREHSAEAVERTRLWRIANRDQWLLQSRINAGRVRSGPAMPAWVDQNEIWRIYAETPEGMVVDHIIPLAVPGLGYSYFEGRKVCGLHVPWNLQHTTQSVNVFKTDDLFKRTRQRRS